MTKHVALLRGIGPTNPNMHQKKLCGVLEKLGFSNVQGVISSGNVIFESDSEDATALEALIEKAWPEQLGFTSTTIVRSRKELLDLAEKDPFKGFEHSNRSYLMVTFFKHEAKIPFKLPYQPPGKTYKLIAACDRSLMSVTDNTAIKTTDLMAWLEKQFGKEITSRTWKTVHRILKKMG